MGEYYENLSISSGRGPPPDPDAISDWVLEILPLQATDGICSSQTETGLYESDTVNIMFMFFVLIISTDGPFKGE